MYSSNSLCKCTEGSKRFTLAPPTTLANSISSATICHANGVICPILATSSGRGSLSHSPAIPHGGRPRGATQPNPTWFLREGGEDTRITEAQDCLGNGHGEFGCKRGKCIKREERNGRNGRVYTGVNHRRAYEAQRSQSHLKLNCNTADLIAKATSMLCADISDSIALR